jgi:FkbM family methyltransferase
MKIKRIFQLAYRSLFPSRVFSKRTYSQCGEDILIDINLRQDKGYKGFYVDIGAHNPFALSNTARFYKRGWRGINVEASSNLLLAFKLFRRRDINLNMAIGDSTQSLKFHIFDIQAFNTFDETLANERIQRGLKLSRIVEIKQIRLDELLDTFLPKGQHIDFMSVDVEGLDYKVLSTNNWDKYKPDIIAVEDYVSDISKSNIQKLLESEGYILTAMIKGGTCIYKVFV